MDKKSLVDLIFFFGGGACGVGGNNGEYMYHSHFFVLLFFSLKMPVCSKGRDVLARLHVRNNLRHLRTITKQLTPLNLFIKPEREAGLLNSDFIKC